MRVALCMFFGAQRHCHDIPAGRPAGTGRPAGAGPMTAVPPAGICRLPAIGRTAAWAASTLTQVSAIRGREAEIAALRDALDLAESGRRAVVLIEGEAGLGTTRRLDAGREDAGRGGV